jgi:hypothetical protein
MNSTKRSLTLRFRIPIMILSWLSVALFLVAAWQYILSFKNLNFDSLALNVLNSIAHLAPILLMALLATVFYQKRKTGLIPLILLIQLCTPALFNDNNFSAVLAYLIYWLRDFAVDITLERVLSILYQLFRVVAYILMAVSLPSALRGFNRLRDKVIPVLSASLSMAAGVIYFGVFFCYESDFNVYEISSFLSAIFFNAAFLLLVTGNSYPSLLRESKKEDEVLPQA